MFTSFNTKITLLEKALDASWLSQEVISGNIANSDTPGYKASEVVFGDFLNAAISQADMKATRMKHFNTAPGSVGLNAFVKHMDTSSLRIDGNNVDLELEMTKLAKNSIYYNALVQSINKEFGKIRTVINGGK